MISYVQGSPGGSTQNYPCRRPQLGSYTLEFIIAGVADKAQIEAVLENVLIPQDDLAWNCVDWIRAALIALEAAASTMNIFKER